MSLILNIIWIVLGGFMLALGWLFLGVICCITIIGIPFGKQCFKFAKLTFAPFGKSVNLKFASHPIANILWAIVAGWEMALGYIAVGIMQCITIIGIPSGLQSFKLAKLGLFPFGAKINNK